MNRQDIIWNLQPAHLYDLCLLLKFYPLVQSNPHKLLSELVTSDRNQWLDSHRREIEEELLRVGSWSFSVNRTYSEIVDALASKIGVSSSPNTSIENLERALLQKFWKDTIARMTPAQIEELKEESKRIAEKYGKSLGAELSGVAALGTAQLSGFGVYVLGSTLLGAVNGALGLGLGFGAFTGLSSLISTIIGPIGWAGLGLAAVVKLGAPN